MHGKPNLKLRQAREEHGWRQIDLAQHLQVDRSTISRWEKGAQTPEHYFIQKICKVFERSPRDLGLLESAEQLNRSLVIDPLLPPLPTFPLVGREATIDSIVHHLQKYAAVISLHGLPGVGKTAVAIAIAHHSTIHEHFDGILWAGVGPTPNIPTLLRHWEMLLEVSTSDLGPKTMLRERTGTRRLLIIIDDVWDIADAVALKHFGGHQCSYLITTRFPPIAAQLGHPQVIAELNSTDSVALLQHFVPEMTIEDSLTLGMLVGCLPLALILIGKYLYVQAYAGQRRRIRAAIERLQNVQQRLQLTDATAHLPTGTASLQSVIAVTLDNQRLNDQARQALKCLSIFPAKPNSFSEEAALFVAVCSIEELDTLTDAGLLEIAGERYQLHQAIADFAKIDVQELQIQAQERFVAYFVTYVETHPDDLLEQERNNILAAMEIAYMLGKSEDFIRILCASVSWLLLPGFYEITKIHLQRAIHASQAVKDSESKMLLLTSMKEQLNRTTWVPNGSEDLQKHGENSEQQLSKGA